MSTCTGLWRATREAILRLKPYHPLFGNVYGNAMFLVMFF